jgi:hypothetical protein
LLSIKPWFRKPLQLRSPPPSPKPWFGKPLQLRSPPSSPNGLGLAKLASVDRNWSRKQNMVTEPSGTCSRNHWLHQRLIGNTAMPSGATKYSWPAQNLRPWHSCNTKTEFTKSETINQLPQSGTPGDNTLGAPIWSKKHDRFQPSSLIERQTHTQSLVHRHC